MAFVPWTPADDSAALGLWLDAADESTKTAAAGALSQWNDKSANARNFAMSTEASKPVADLTVLNGLPTIYFAGDYLSSMDPAAEWNFLHDGTPHQIYVVAKYGTVADPNVAYGLMGNIAGSANSRRGVNIYWDDRASQGRNESFLHLVGNGAASGQIVENLTGNGFHPANTHRVMSILSDFGAAAADRSIFTVDGGAGVKNSAKALAASAGAAWGPFDIGALGGGVAPLIGEIAEIIIRVGTFDATLNDKYIGYLHHRWALQGFMPSGHPYKDAPPGETIFEGGEIIGTVTIDGAPAQRQLIGISYDPQAFDGEEIPRRIVVGETTSAEDGTYTLETPGFLDEVIVLALDNYGEVWRPNRSYTVGQRIRPTFGNETGYGYDITIAGNSGETEPVWWIPAGGNDTGAIGAATAQAKPLWWSVAHAPILPTPSAVITLWTPTEIATALWLDADDESTITAAFAGEVSDWFDKSGSAINFTQAAAAARPITGTTTINLKNTLSFDGGDTLLSTAIKSTWTFLHDGTPWDAFIVAKMGSTLDPNTVYGILATSAYSRTTRGFAIAWDDRGSFGFERAHRLAVNSGNNSTNQPTDGYTNNSQPGATAGLAHIRSAAAAAAPIDRFVARSNGGPEIAQVMALGNQSGAVSVSDSTYDLTIGALGGGTAKLVGEIAEIIVVASHLSDPDRERIEGYLAWKWGLHDNLPAEHPYKSAAPTL